jgi:hypothetical protein
MERDRLAAAYSIGLTSGGLPSGVAMQPPAKVFNTISSRQTAPARVIARPYIRPTAAWRCRHVPARDGALILAGPSFARPPALRVIETRPYAIPEAVEWKL